ncbi:rhodanese-like domain-containing protein [Alicyclobacillus mengziensis]|uniref:Rhodanese-like domain-containing protein n=1 Tax=Alicyclobacillus mengziensis TaxID=2931921 RepID=A0A9X7W1N5_9BACL|nr:rhodanese-like domain-containing protein [Alicyclobacillus mengziensis]QSO48847.1 rhodanese-like domain-containing protein [Alicyclobacillus mengziensis]
MNIFNLFRHPSGLRDLSPQDILKHMQQNPEVVILDVRTPMEYRSGHIANAKSYPLGQESLIAKDYPRDTPLLLICKSGHRSQAAANTLMKLGFHQLSHLQGGMDRWKREGLPTKS